MKKGLSLLFNDVLKASSAPIENEWLNLSVSTYQDSCSCYFEKFSKIESSALFYSTKLSIHDKIEVLVGTKGEVSEYPFSYDSFLDSMMLERYCYLESILSEKVREESKIGFHCSINGDVLTIPFRGNNRIKATINQNTERIKIIVGATSSIDDSSIKTKILYEAFLEPGDEVLVELKNVENETKPISEVIQHLDRKNKMNEEIEILYAMLVEKGLLK